MIAKLLHISMEGYNTSLTSQKYILHLWFLFYLGGAVMKNIYRNLCVHFHTIDLEIFIVKYFRGFGVNHKNKNSKYKNKSLWSAHFAYTVSQCSYLYLFSARWLFVLAQLDSYFTREGL